MVVTEARINLVNSKSSLVAFATITLDGSLVVKGLKVINGNKGLFVSMPSSEGHDGKFYDDVFPITKDLRNEINDAVLDAYEDEVAGSKKKAPRRR